MKKILGIFLLSVFIILNFTGCGSEEKEKEITISDLRVVAKEGIKNNIKTPATAEFLDSNEDWHVKELATGDNNIKKYSICSYVDAENEFGAKIRNRFVVIAQFNLEKDTYQILDVKLMSR